MNCLKRNSCTFSIKEMLLVGLLVILLPGAGHSVGWTGWNQRYGISEQTPEEGVLAWYDAHRTGGAPHRFAAHPGEMIMDSPTSGCTTLENRYGSKIYGACARFWGCPSDSRLEILDGKARCVSGNNAGEPVCKNWGTNPINILNGNKYQVVRVVESLGTTQLALNFYFNSKNFWDKWFHDYQSHIVGGFEGALQNTDSPKEYVINVQRAKGNALRFTNVTDAADPIRNLQQWVGEEGGKEELSPIIDGDVLTGFTVRYPDNSSEEFDLAGHLVTRTMANGRRHSVEYDEYGTLERVVDDISGAALVFSREGNRLVIIDPIGAQYFIDMDSVGNGDLQQITFPTEHTLVPDGSVIKTFQYDDPENPRFLTGIVDENETLSNRWGFDSQGRANLSEHGGGVNSYLVEYVTDNTRNVTDPLGAVRSYSFDPEWQHDEVVSIDGGVCSYCGGKAFTYSGGFVESIIDFNDIQKSYVRDNLGRILSRVEAHGTAVARTTEIEWHPVHHRPTKITESGRVTRMTYDDQGRRLSRRVESVIH